MTGVQTCALPISSEPFPVIDTVSNQVSITGNGSEVVHGDDNGDVVVEDRKSVV